MNEIAREKVTARQEAEALSDAELPARHSYHILRVEAILREIANRLDATNEAPLACDVVAELHMVQAAHARLTAMLMRRDSSVIVRSGER